MSEGAWAEGKEWYAHAAGLHQTPGCVGTAGGVGTR